MNRLNFLEETRYEKLQVKVFESELEACRKVARQISDLIQRNNKDSRPTVLGLATGSSPILLYKELVRLHKTESLNFEHVISFNLDEYYPMHPEATQSYVKYMHQHLFDHVNISKENINIPDGTLSKDQIHDYCIDYEQRINELGGLDLQILGIGRTGHIGFNEPGSAPNSGTRLVTLDDLTRRDASREFGGKKNVPTKAITMGIGTIFKAREIILLAWSKKKAPIIKKAVEGKISGKVPATYLQLFDNVQIIVDKDAASALTRFDTPWLVKDCNWNEDLIKKAVIWLSGKVNKPVLKLTDDDYNKYGMAQLITEKGPAYDLNIKIFNLLQHSITGWPGGKPNADDSQRPERKDPAQKRCLIFAPHPDDDVVSMGGTFIRLIKQGHNVSVAYQTSGNTAVWDSDVLRYIEFARDFNDSLYLSTKKLDLVYDEMREFISKKKPKENDPEIIKQVKAFIRKSEAIAAARFAGTKDENIHFLNLPFYEHAEASKPPAIDKDIQQTMDLLQKIKPHQVYAAGDFSDPHGTHIICFKIIIEALRKLKKTEDWTKDCWLWLYRGAWQEFPIHEVQMAVPLSPKEVEQKRMAIFKHQSQKDHPVFPGDDEREFWQRAEQRNRETAEAYHRLGLADYEAMEAFVKWDF